MPLIQLKQAQLEVVQIPAPDSASAPKAPIVFLHEGLGSVAMWKSRAGFWPEQVCAATGRAGVVYSRRGYGQSQDIEDIRGANRLPADYMHHEAWQVLPELLEALHIKNPVLLGHSDGGTIALLHAARFALSACIVMAPHVLVEDVSITAIEASREAFVSGDLRERLARFHAHVDTAFWQWNDVWLSSAFRSFDIRNDCTQIACDVLALQGIDDAYGTMQQIDDIQPSSGRITRRALPGCAHSPHRDQPELVLQEVLNFLQDKA
jgi:pimeloyl-ACP methyl ester carboxylesterase